MNAKVLVIGANGQLGSVLVKALQHRYGDENVIASDIQKVNSFNGVFELLDATNMNKIQDVVSSHGITQIYHLAAILSAKGEANPLGTWELNMNMLFNVLEVSRINGLDKVFFPSSIAVFGEDAPWVNTPNNAYLNPATVYGMSKAAGENWAQYYFLRYGLDVRSIRYPGIIGYQSLPGGGTTDYAVDIFHKAVLEEEFVCFLNADTTLPMIFMDDVIRATLELMEAPKKDIRIRTAYNLAGSSFSPEDIVKEIYKYYPEFKVKYEPDFRQDIAARWPKSINDVEAKVDWGWQPKYDLEMTARTMIEKLKAQYIPHE
ncbi:NAD-dependent epimerase/dehydratase family protein [Arenibacter sp. F20364]|uniref:NAD-dependent epimerase/dehydratase family protein n=1 Tax=Arenibacter sp. F20364 TaxID=2926415 RepID=UPI001FF60447|nr:NAD-dependent epimerase/dehydratase family protein [Arenibacter sp. F20364]MCK0191441.1 NAD-dependent epimerase/dehydratase family protein [Arenibacter sp. F20364]